VLVIGMQLGSAELAVHSSVTITCNSLYGRCEMFTFHVCAFYS
jgi:hypothetical protein